MAQTTIRDLSPGANQRGVRAHNERLILSMIQRHGSLPGSELAKRAGLSPQTVSVILRGLESEGFLEKGPPQRGHVGKPRIPMRLRPDGAFSVGLKIGRRNAALVLADFNGTVIHHRDINYAYPMPDHVMGFLQEGLARFESALGPQADRIAGIGVARPYEVWEWPEAIGASPLDLKVWEQIDLHQTIATFSALPVYPMNDATAACHAEHVFGRGREFRDYGYIFMGSFIGGGIVLNSTVFEGPQGNAGAFGPLPAITRAGEEKQLLDVASLYLLEDSMRRAGRDPSLLRTGIADWSAHEDLVAPWIAAAAPHLARSALTLAAVIDFEAVLIDGAFPPDIRARLVDRVRDEMDKRDARGLIRPRIESGSIGHRARELGAATGPFFARYLLNTHIGLGTA